MRFDRGKSGASVLRMILLGLVLISPAFLAGLNQTYVAVALPQMQLTLSDASWFGSLSSFSAPVSCILVGLLIDRVGRKVVLVYSVAASVVGWTLMLSNLSPDVVLLGQMFNGLTTGAVGYASQVYAGECVMVNNVRLRNSFLMWNGVGGTVGSTSALLMANFIDYRQICAVCFLLAITLLVILCRVIPESPAWLYCKGRRGDAEWAASKLGLAQPILAADPEGAQAAPIPVACKSTSAISWSTVRTEAKKFGRPDVYKPMLIFTSINILLAASGPSTLLTYMINIIENDIPGATGPGSSSSVIHTNYPIPYVPYVVPHNSQNHLLPEMAPNPAFLELTRIDEALPNPTSGNAAATLAATASGTSAAPVHKYVPTVANAYSLIIGLLMCVTCLTASMIIPYVGIRNCVSTSAAFSSVAFLVLAFTTTFFESTPQAMTWRVVAIMMVAVLYSLSCGSSDAVLGDVLPADAKGFASLISVCSFLALAITNKAFPYLYAWLGGYVYVFFTIISISVVYFIRAFMPEVSGKTLDQIQKEFLTV